MKKIMLLTLALCGAIWLHAQRAPASVMSSVPAMPGKLCETDTLIRRKYSEMHHQFARILSEEIGWRKEQERKLREGLEQQMKSNMAKKYGFSQGDVQRMDNMKNMTKAEREKLRKEMADKMMMQSKTGMTSVEDVTGIKDVKSKEGKTAYAKNLAKPMEAEKVGDSANLARENSRIKKLNTLIAEQESLLKSLNAMEAKYEQQYWELETDPLKLKLEAEMKVKDSLKVDYDLAGGSPPNPYTEEIITLKQTYCSAFSPRFAEITSHYIATVSSKLTQYARLEVLTDEIYKLQNGTTQSPVVPGLLQLQKISQCTSGLGGLFKFNLLHESDQTTKEE